MKILELMLMERLNKIPQTFSIDEYNTEISFKLEETVINLDADIGITKVSLSELIELFEKATDFEDNYSLEKLIFMAEYMIDNDTVSQEEIDSLIFEIRSNINIE